MKELGQISNDKRIWLNVYTILGKAVLQAVYSITNETAPKAIPSSIAFILIITL